MALKISGSGGGFVSKGSGGGLKIKIAQSSIPSIVTSGLVLYIDAGNPASYPGSGTTWTDLSGQGNDAILTNGPIFDSGNGGSIIFDGSNEHAPMTTNGFPFGSSAGTISCWANVASVSAGFLWIVAYGNAVIGQSRFLGTNGNTYYYGGYGDDITASGVTINTWFNMVGVYNGSTASIYINGALVSGPTAKSWNTIANASAVARQTNGAEYWNGKIAQVLVYNQALSDAEVLQNFNVDKTRFGL